jgi:hypothetical protein
MKNGVRVGDVAEGGGLFTFSRKRKGPCPTSFETAISGERSLDVSCDHVLVQDKMADIGSKWPTKKTAAK